MNDVTRGNVESVRPMEGTSTRAEADLPVATLAYDASSAEGGAFRKLLGGLIIIDATVGLFRDGVSMSYFFPIFTRGLSFSRATGPELGAGALVVFVVLSAIWQFIAGFRLARRRIRARRSATYAVCCRLVFTEGYNVIWIFYFTTYYFARGRLSLYQHVMVYLFRFEPFIEAVALGIFIVFALNTRPAKHLLDA